MNLKKVLFPIISLVLSKIAYDAVKILLSQDPDTFGVVVNIIIAFILNLLITGIFEFVGFAYPTSKVLLASYYKVKNGSRLNFWYRILGVKYFRVLLMVAFWGKSKNRKKYFNGNRTGLQNLIYQTKQSEFGHLAAFIVITLICVLLLFYGYYLLCILTMTINIMGNIYPVILQRRHRVRIGRIDL